MGVKNKKSIITVAFGNTIELYDHAIFGILLVFIINNFFINDSNQDNILYASILFGITNISRPIGALLGSKLVRLIGNKNLFALHSQNAYCNTPH